MEVQKYFEDMFYKIEHKIGDVEKRIDNKMHGWIQNLNSKIDEIQISIKDIQNKQSNDQSNIAVLNEKINNIKMDLDQFAMSERDKHNKLDHRIEDMDKKINEFENEQISSVTNQKWLISITLMLIAQILTTVFMLIKGFIK